MGERTITISEFELGDCENNLRKLRDKWSSIPIINGNLFYHSRGCSSKVANECHITATDLSNAMQRLLDNTSQYLVNLRNSYANSDAKAAERIDQLVK